MPLVTLPLRRGLQPNLMVGLWEVVAFFFPHARKLKLSLQTSVFVKSPLALSSRATILLPKNRQWTIFRHRNCRYIVINIFAIDLISCSDTT